LTQIRFLTQSRQDAKGIFHRINRIPGTGFRIQRLGFRNNNRKLNKNGQDIRDSNPSTMLRTSLSTDFTDYTECGYIILTTEAQSPQRMDRPGRTFLTQRRGDRREGLFHRIDMIIRIYRIRNYFKG
jgi:hypothetical protein